jgi:hypothetical protein
MFTSYKTGVVTELDHVERGSMIIKIEISCKQQCNEGTRLAPPPGDIISITLSIYFKYLLSLIKVNKGLIIVIYKVST